MVRTLRSTRIKIHLARAKPKPGRALARPGDPYVTARGKVVLPESNPAGLEDARPMTVNAAEFRAKRKRSAKELPAPPAIMNGVGAVMVYTFMGLGDNEICGILKISASDLKKVRLHSAYSETFESVVGELVNSNSDLLTSRIAAYAHGALDQVAYISKNGKNEGNKLRASTDILDRAGVSPKENSQRANVIKNELRIVYVDGEKTPSVEIKTEVTNVEEEVYDRDRDGDLN